MSGTSNSSDRPPGSLSPRARGVLNLAVAALLRSSGVPGPVADRIAPYVVKVALATLGMLLMLIIALLVAPFNSERSMAASDARPSVATDPSFGRIPESMREAYAAAAEKEGVPWTVLAAVAEVTTVHGRYDPNGGPIPPVLASGYAEQWVTPLSGRVHMIADVSAPALADLAAAVGMPAGSQVAHDGDPTSIPAAVRSIGASSGDAVVVAIGSIDPGTDSDAIAAAAAMSVLAAPPGVEVWWYTFDRPDWYLDVQVIPADVRRIDGRDVVIAEERTVEEWVLLSEDNLSAHLNSALVAAAGSVWPAPRLLDWESMRTDPGREPMRPGPTGSYADAEALGADRAANLRLLLASRGFRGAYAETLPDPTGECPQVRIGFGSGTDRGHGPFMIVPERLLRAGLYATPEMLHDACRSAEIMAKLIYRMLEQELRARGLRGEEDDLLNLHSIRIRDPQAIEEIRSVWRGTLGRTLAFIDLSRGCESLLDAPEPATPAAGIVQMWECVLQNSPPNAYEMREMSAGSPPVRRARDRADAVSAAVSEAVAVSWRYSQHQPCTLFPMSDAQFRSNVGVSPADRCDVRHEALAAARLFAASAAQPPSGWLGGTGGWHAFEMVLGPDEYSSGFAEHGPLRSRAYPPACISEVRDVLRAAAATEAMKQVGVDRMKVAVESLQDAVRPRSEQILADRAVLFAAVTAAEQELLDPEVCGGIIHDVYEARALLAEPEDDLAYTSIDGAWFRSTETLAGLLSIYAGGIEAYPSIPGRYGEHPLLDSAARHPLRWDPAPPAPVSRVSLPDAHLSRVEAALFSVSGGPFAAAAWEMESYAPLPAHVTHAAEINASGPFDPRFLLAAMLETGDGEVSPERSAELAGRIASYHLEAGGSYQAAAYATSLGEDVLDDWAERPGAGIPGLVESRPREVLGEGDPILRRWLQLQVMVPADAQVAVSYATRLTILAAEGEWIAPLPRPLLLSSGFGNRLHPVFRTVRLHAGIDLGAPMGAPAFASRSGRVSFSGWMKGYGLSVIIDHGDGTSTLYAHFSRLLAAVGDTVVQGQPIGLVGMTGTATGPHVHFEIRMQGDPIDPCPLIAC